MEAGTAPQSGEVALEAYVCGEVLADEMAGLVDGAGMPPAEEPRCIRGRVMKLLTEEEYGYSPG